MIDPPSNGRKEKTGDRRHTFLLILRAILDAVHCFIHVQALNQIPSQQTTKLF